MGEYLKSKALLYLTSVFLYNFAFTSGASRPRKIFNLSGFVYYMSIEYPRPPLHPTWLF